jgi:translation initiation factor 2D
VPFTFNLYRYNEGYLEDAVVPLGGGGGGLSSEEDEEEEEEEGEGGDSGGEEGGGSGGGGGGDAKGVEEGGAEGVETLEEGVKELGLKGSAAAGDDGEADAGVAPPYPQQQQLTPSEMDALVDRAVLQALRAGVKDKALPLLGSAFWAQHVVPSRPAADGVLLDVKRGSHKKLSKLLLSKMHEGWITVKEDKHTKEMVLTSVNRKHADLTSHRSHETAAEVGLALFTTALLCSQNTKNTNSTDDSRQY